MVYTDGTHLVADTLAELHSFALSIGLKRKWFQDHRRHPHYDLTTRRAARRAISNGAVLVSPRRIVHVAHALVEEPYSHSELMQTLARLAGCGYVCGGFGVKELVDKGWAELEEPHWGYQYAAATNAGLIELGEWVLAEEEQTTIGENPEPGGRCERQPVG